MTYRIVHNLVDIPANLYLHSATVSRQRGRNVCYYIPFCHTDIYRHSFFQAAVLLWNQLPVAIATAPSLDSFKAGLAILH